MSIVYLDNAATTRTSAAALDAMRDVYAGDAFANPASQHIAGDAALRVLESSRRRIAERLHARPSEVEFTSCGSEANNQALLTGAAYGAREGRRHIVASAIEHPSVLRMLELLSSPDGPYGGNFEVTLVKPDANGLISVADVKAAMRPDTCLVSLMYANNEVGAVQPVRDVCRMARKRGALFHTDAVQATGHLPIDFTRDGFDLLTLSAHKFHGPRGMGALVCSHRVVPASLVLGGAQERGHRAGTSNVAGAAGMAAALDEACEKLDANASQVEALRARFVRGLAGIEGAHALGPVDPALRLPGIVAVTLDGVDHQRSLVLLDELGICMSAGSACAAGALEESHVLSAMGISPEVGRTYLRVSLDVEENDEADVDRAVEAIAMVAARLRKRGEARPAQPPAAANPPSDAPAGGDAR